ncbi:MAG: MlaD family protein [Puniceicoccales bacterium]|jgi:paraquat-inducible protein B|nr:MlaD family protein [Puniceicoccales bacterium]
MKLNDSTSVGIFVAGGILAFIAAIFLFTSGPIFSGRSHTFVLYFNESVNGLEVGAPVKLRGVRIGQVKRIMAHFNPERERMLVSVTIGIEDVYFRSGRRERLRLAVADRKKFFGDPDDETPHAESAFYRSPLIVGMVGSLQMESLVTGKLFVGLEYAPTPAGKYLRPDGDGISEIPTRPSNLESFSDHLSAITEGLSRVNYTAIGSSIERIMSSVAAMDLGTFSQVITNLASTVSEALADDDARKAFSSLAALCVNLAGLSSAVNAELIPALPQIRLAVEKASGEIANLFAMFGPNSKVSFYVSGFLRAMEGAARAMGLFFEYLEQHPNAILAGRASGEP